MRSRKLTSNLLTGVLALLPSLATAQLPKEFSLARFVPEGPWLYVHAVHNPEREWIEREWAEVFQTLKDSGVGEDILRLITSALDADTGAMAQAQFDKAAKLIGAVHWNDLLHEEIVFTERFTFSGQKANPTAEDYAFEYLLLMRGREGSGQQNFEGLTEILKEISCMSGRPLEQHQVMDLEVQSLQFAPQKDGDPAFAFHLFRKGDIIGLTTDKRLLSDVASLMAGKSQKKAIIQNARFQAAMKEVPVPNDAVVYFDFRAFIADMRTMFATIIARKNAAQGAPTPGAQLPQGDGPIARVSMKIEPPAGKSPQGADHGNAQAAAVFSKVFDLVDVPDYFITSTETKGRRELSHTVCKLQEGKQNAPLATAFLNRKPFERFDQFLPADAVAFSLSELVDFEKLYNLCIDFVSREIPGGNEAIAQFKAAMESIGFDPARDLFSWLSGELISVEMPPPFPGPLASPEWVVFIRVKDAEIASAKVNRFVDFVTARLKAEKQMIMVMPAKVQADGFREITHPLLAMMMFKPVFGVYGDWLVLGSSANAINKCLDVASGKAPSIATNPRFQEEGIHPTGPVAGLSFADTSNFGQEIAQAIAAVGMVGPIMLAGLPGNTPEEKKAKDIIESGVKIILKLAPVAQKIDFYSSEASMSTYDGKLTIRNEAAVTYKPPSGPVDEHGIPKPPCVPTPPPAPKQPRPSARPTPDRD